MTENPDDTPQAPGQSLWPIGFAIGVAVVLVGLVISVAAIVLGAALTIVFGLLWIRDASRTHAPVDSAPAHELMGDTPSPGLAAAEEQHLETYGRAGFLTLATIGVGGIIGAAVTLPSLGFAVIPSFEGEGVESPDVDLGPISNFPEGTFVITTFTANKLQGDVSRRTAYIRNNGFIDNVPSFTVLSNRCAHLGCPVQPNGPIFDKQKVEQTTKTGDVSLIPALPAGGFGCPCHGGQYDQEGNRTAGPPVRALDRYEFYIRNGNLALGKTYSVSHVVGAGASARIHKYKETGPGQHVDGPEQWFYPLQPPT